MNPTVPLFSSRAVNADTNLYQAVQRVLDSHWYVLGQEVTRFEQAFAAYCGVDHCVSLANGTDAIELALRALGIGAGDQVALVANAGFYGSTAVRLLGAEPNYVDVDPHLLTMSPDSLERVLEQEPKAVIVTHLYGQLANIDAIIKLAAAADVPVIEDCAQAHGASRGGRRAGSFGAIGCYSFYPTKNLGALGDGGAVVCRDAALAGRVRQLRQYGWNNKYSVEMAGGRNSRLDEIQAAILNEKLPHLDACNRQRRGVARRYNEAFQNLPVTCPPCCGDDYVAHLYVLQVPEREKFRAKLAEAGVTTDVHYPIPDHLQTAYLPSQKLGSLPVTERVSAVVVSLPCFPGMSEEAVEHVVSACLRAFDAKPA